MDWARLVAQRAAGLEASGIRKIFDLAATLKDPVNLSIGQPDFDVPEPVKETAAAALREGFNRYTPSGGIPELRKAVIARFEKLHGTRPEDVLITSGVSGGLTLALLALVNPGDEVLVPDPYFVSYKHLTGLCGGTPVYYDTYPNFTVKVPALEKLVTPRTKVILAMSPGNPTGACLDDSTKRELAEFARRKGLALISDEIYELFTYGGSADRSLLAYYPEGTVSLSGLSKTASMTGWRVGWAVGPKVLIDQMTKLQQFTFVCAPSFAQKAALSAFESDLSAAVPLYRQKRDFLVQGLRSAGYEVNEPGGAFYLFPRVPPKYPSGQAFVEEAVRRELLLVPGNVFSERDTHFRISFAAPDAKLEAGLRIMREMAR
ncbi:MAG: aminotransferase class I/II-fold pyridoxal phosphate-dependent enzyme [Planctomycetes bacterium]|nr:aminotransferase class I/II-fold pyridoxal phosphate-dependent enzyme [Planctomycetota bacterium]